MHYLDIELKGLDENGHEKKYKLCDFKGHNLIVYFYPEDDTPLCTKEANKFKEALEKLKKHAHIIGVSHNDINAHKDFWQEHHLNFPLLCDVENKLKDAFKKHHKDVNHINRSTFILDKDGNIIKYWEKVDVDDHVEEIIKFFEMEDKK